VAFASGGHPAALLIDPATPEAPGIVRLGTCGPPVGCFEQASFYAGDRSVALGARLLLFSDGIFEIFQPGEVVGTFEEFVRDLARPEILALHPAERLGRAQKIRGAALLEDDFSLVELRFH
jgi:sigma-B regulation protein RsbU (phosphoserine phosphatase)